MRHVVWLLLGLGAITATKAQAQRTVSYDIDVTLDDVQHRLLGHISIHYTNPSFRPLDTLWFHLWPNAYRDNTSALVHQQVSRGDLALHFARPDDRGYIGDLAFTADDRPLTWGEHPEHADIAWIKMHETLAPGATILISTPFTVKIPSGKYSRLGHLGRSYQITQWYPKPALLNEGGWHIMPYLDQGEFFSDFGNFNVRITLPANYVVGATGQLLERSEQAFMDSLAQRPIRMLDEGSEPFPASATENKTITFVQDNVVDFAWFADPRYQVRKGQVTLPNSDRTVQTWVLFTATNAVHWEHGIEYLNAATLAYSEWVGNYPYDQITAVDGTISAGGGMEYPMITVIGNVSSDMELDVVITHEAGHNWFQAILASNERDEPWMDEGINSYYEMRHIRARYPQAGVAGLPGSANLFKEQSSKQGYRLQNELLYRFNARRDKDQALDLPSDEYTMINYGCMVYAKTALVFDHLATYLGQASFDRAMQAYYEKWKFGHPGPADLRNSLESSTGKDLEWVFDDLVHTDLHFDPQARSFDGKTATYSLGNGAIAPFQITFFAGSEELATVWEEDGDGTLAFGSTDGVIPDRMVIDHAERTLDIDRRNNEARTKGLIERGAPIKFKFLAGLERSDQRALYWSPIVASSAADGFMVGTAIYNTTFPSQPTEWVLAPMYSTQAGILSGGARISQHFDRSRRDLLRGLSFELSGRRSAVLDTDELSLNYSKLAPAIEYDLHAAQVARRDRVTLRARSILTFERGVLRSEGTSAINTTSDEAYHELSGTWRNDQCLDPWQIQLRALGNDEMLNISIDARAAAPLNDRGDRVSLRMFAGKFLWSELKDPRLAFRAAARDGSADFLYDAVFIGRAETAGIWPQQYMLSDGGFKSPTLNGRTDDWLLAFNLEIDVPIPIPLALFAGTSTSPVTVVAQDGTSRNEIRTLFEAGVGIRVIRDIFEVWMPLTYSALIKDEFNFREIEPYEQIRFILALDKLDPTRFLRKAAP